MAKGLVEQATMEAIAQAIREKLDLPDRIVDNVVYEEVSEKTLYSATPNIDKETGVQNGSYPNNLTQIEVLTIPNAESLHITIVCNKSDSSDKLCAWQGSHPDYIPYLDQPASFTGFINGNVTKEYDIPGDTVTIGFTSDSSGQGWGYRATITGVEREIVSQDVTYINRYKPAEMASAISDIGISKEIHIGIYSSTYLKDIIDFLSLPDYTVYLHPSKYIPSTNGMMYNISGPSLPQVTLADLPSSLQINCDIKLDLTRFSDGTRCYPSSVSKTNFKLNCSGCKIDIPQAIVDMVADNGGGLVLPKAFYNTNYPSVDHIIEPFYNGWLEDTDILHPTTSVNVGSMFSGNNYLKKIDCGKIPRTAWSQGSSSYQFVYSAFFNCYRLGEALNIWAPDNSTSSLTSNAFASTFSKCYTLSRITFAPSRKVGTISNQVIDLSTVGYGLASANSSLPQVTDDETYTLYKDVEYRTSLKEYSRYGHDSFVETINTLPVVDSGTIKVYGTCGASTDQGAISDLTDEEIAVATEKGWTITLQ